MSQMDNMVTRLSEIDQEAQRIVETAAARKKELESQSREQKKIFDRELEEKTRETLESLKEKLETEMEQELAGLREESKKALELLDKQYENSHEALAEELFRRVTAPPGPEN